MERPGPSNLGRPPARPSGASARDTDPPRTASKEEPSLMKSSPFALLAVAAALVGVSALGKAMIERLDLAQMVQKTDNTVFGTIVARNVVRIDHPVDGPELYFTTPTIEGRSLENDKPVTVDVSHMGGWIDETHGAFNSEAPSADDTKVG